MHYSFWVTFPTLFIIMECGMCPLQGARNLNPIPYQGYYMGHKLHMDQNEKLVMFGVTHVIALDGYSGNIVAHSSMPVKNNLVIYEEVYRWLSTH